MMKRLIVVFLIVLLSGTVSGCKSSPQEILLDTASVETETVSGEVLTSEALSDDIEEQKTQAENSEAKTVEEDQGISELPTEESASDMIYVYVCGAVNRPGVYELPTGSRAYEAVDMAGGVLESAQADAVNLAEVLTDGQKLQIPFPGEAVSSGEHLSSEDHRESTTAKININTATAEQLMTLKGIGQTRAEDIIAYREKHGSFQKPEDIMQVDGIKQGTYDKMKDNISVQ